MAEASYKERASSATPKFFDSYFNIGVLYNNRAAYEYEGQQREGRREVPKLKKVADDIYIRAVPLLRAGIN